MKFTYCNTDTNAFSQDINDLLPGFSKDEVLAVMSPHDDDAMLAAQRAGADVYVVIFCRGDAGCSVIEEKDTIEQVRERETYDCYARMGIPAEHILRMNREEVKGAARSKERLTCMVIDQVDADYASIV